MGEVPQENAKNGLNVDKKNCGQCYTLLITGTPLPLEENYCDFTSGSDKLLYSNFYAATLFQVSTV